MDRTTTSRTGVVLLALKAGLAAAAVAALLAGRVPDVAIVVGVIVAASLVSWRRTPLVPARVRSHHRFTVVSRCGDEFVTIDSAGARRVVRHVAVDGPAS